MWEVHYGQALSSLHYYYLIIILLIILIPIIMSFIISLPKRHTERERSLPRFAHLEKRRAGADRVYWTQRPHAKRCVTALFPRAMITTRVPSSELQSSRASPGILLHPASALCPHLPGWLPGQDLANLP